VTKRVKQILRGGIDFFRVNEDNTDISFGGCGGAPASSFDVNAIPDGTAVTLIRGATRQRVVIRSDMGTFECNYNVFTAGPTVSRRLRLVSRARYSFVYNSDNQTIVIRRKPVSTERVQVFADAAIRTNQIGLGDGLQERLGYSRTQGLSISVTGGGQRKTLTVRTIQPGEDELFRYEIRLHPQNYSLFGLGSSPGTFDVSYNQVSRILRFIRRVSARRAAPVKKAPFRKKQNRA
jgi:hypothetical protein